MNYKTAIQPQIFPLASGNLTDTAPRFQPKDPISALTHFIGFLAAIFGLPILLIRAGERGCSTGALVSLSIFMLSMIFLYGASASYHAFQISPPMDMVLKKLDHSMIFILIAGSYTPICVMVLEENTGRELLVLVWTIALLGISFKLCWVTCPKWVSSVIYIGMGWICLLALKEIYHNLPTVPFLWLLAGGIIYTIGGVIYALKLPILSDHFEGFGAHELFHLFVMGGSLCHFLCMYSYI